MNRFPRPSFISPDDFLDWPAEDSDSPPPSPAGDSLALDRPPADTGAGGVSMLEDAPTPWRAVRGWSELSSINAANGRSVAVVRHAYADFIVRCVNAMVPGGRGPF